MHPQRHPIRPQQLSAEQVQKQREYLMQQQKLRLMSASNTQKVVSADTLIQNLLGRKDTFKPIDPLAPSTFAAACPEKIDESTKFQQAHFDPRLPSNQQVAVEWLSPKSPNFPEVYRKVFNMAGEPDGMVDTGKIFPLLLTSGLHTDVLGYIWGLVNRCVAGKLTENELYAVLALVALAQKGYSFNTANVLSLVPQPPIPNLNLETNSQIPNKMRREDLNLQSQISTHMPNQSSMAQSIVSQPNANYDQPVVSAAQLQIFDTQFTVASASNTDDFDDFTEFQSATASVSNLSLTTKTSASTQKSMAITLDERDKESVTTKTTMPASIGSAYPADPTSFPEPVFVQKFPAVNVVSGGRSIGSRLANHSLGASKMSKTRHHKHHHHHRVSLPSPTNPVEEEFTDFQQATSEDTFSKCLPNQPRFLKESAIRQETSVSPKHIPSKAESSKENVKALESVDLAKVLEPPPTVVTSEKVSELMGVEEDRYGALRALSLFDPEPSASKDDDFGDFFSTESAVADDSFADIATRVNPSVDDADIPRNSPKIELPSSVPFEVDDWGTFESAADLTTEISSTVELKGMSNFDFTTGDWQKELSAVKNHSSQITDLNIDVVSLPPMSLGNEHTVPTFTGSLMNPIVPSVLNSPRQSNSISGNQQANEEDDFGEFISPKTWLDEGSNLDIQLDTISWQEESKEADSQSVGSLWLDDSKAAAEQPWSEEGKLEQGKVSKEKILDNPLVSHLWLEESKGLDNQSVSSLELPGLEHAWDAVGEWRRCLQSCLTILQFAVNTFDALVEPKVLLEVLNSVEGQNYLKNLVEVWYVCERIATSYQKTGLDQKIDALLNSTSTIWSLLKPHYAQAKLSIESAISAAGPDMCSVCLADGATIDFEGHSYHAPCANLWLNNIDTVLPALHQP